METTIQEVIELGLKEHLLEVPWNSGKPEHENSRILQVLECCARARDVKAIAKVVLNLDAKKTTTTKKDSLIALRRKALTGRTLFGGTIRLLPPAKKALYSQDKHTIFRVSLDLQVSYFPSSSWTHALFRPNYSHIRIFTIAFIPCITWSPTRHRYRAVHHPGLLTVLPLAAFGEWEGPPAQLTPQA